MGVKYLYVPKWLKNKLEKVGVNLNVILDYEKLSSILSREELIYYNTAMCCCSRTLNKYSMGLTIYGIEFKVPDQLEFHTSLASTKFESKVEDPQTHGLLYCGPVDLEEPSKFIYDYSIEVVDIAQDIIGIVPIEPVGRDLFVIKNNYELVMKSLNRYLPHNEITKLDLFKRYVDLPTC